MYDIGREDKLNADNKTLVNNYQVELADQISSLCNMVMKCMSRQLEHIQSVEKLCHSFVDGQDKVSYEELSTLCSLY